MFERPNKLQHAATFAITFPKVDSDNNLLEIPRIALVCNFSFARNDQCLLAHHEAETLFHEFGHCLSALLSRTRFQHVAGTRGALDFVETPSTLMEYFISDHRVVKLFAKHYKTGQEIPEQSLNNLIAARNMFAATETAEQVCYAMFDQLIHGPHPLNKSTTNIFKEIRNKYSLIPYVDNTYWHASFSHLASYGASYYSYLFCRIFSSNIWAKGFQADPLNRKSGEKYRTQMLHFGGGKDPQTIVNNLLGQAPDLQTFLDQHK